MSNVDLALLRAAGLNAAKAAGVLGKTRQTVSRGVKHARVDYFKDADVRLIYAAAEVDSPTLLPGLREFIRVHHRDVAELLGITQAYTPFDDRADDARLAWLLLPDFRFRQQEIWPSVRALMERNRLAIDVYTDDELAHRAFQSLGETTLAEVRQANKNLQAQVKLWDPLPVIGLIAKPTVIFDPLDERVSGYNWTPTGYDVMANEDAARLVSVLMGRVMSPRPEEDQVHIRRLGATTGAKLETIRKTEWADWVATNSFAA